MIEVKMLKILLLLFYITEAQSYYPPWIRTFKPNQGVPWHDGYFCKDNNELVLTFKATEISTYYVWINEILDAGTEITVKFNAEASVFINLSSNTENNSRFTKEPDTINNIYTFEFTNKTAKLRELFRVEGNTPYHQIHITSLKINGVEKCHNPDMEVFGKLHTRYNFLPEAPDKICGRRKINVQNLTVSESATTSGWWPWHAAIYMLQNDKLTYICGGTLLSKHLVLTAAHCISTSGIPYNPEILEVALGKYYLFGNGLGAQSVKGVQIILHEEYNHTNLNNDIALIKLMNEVIFNNYVQPACIWFDGIYDVLGTHEVTGSVVGWGFDGIGEVNKTLKIHNIPQIPDVTCLLFQPVFYHALLNGKTFCAGYQNGITSCDGDSGGAFMVFVEDYKPPTKFYESTSLGPGAWYVKGIVSATLLTERNDSVVCDPNGYTVFTDVAKYRDWILNYVSQNN